MQLFDKYNQTWLIDKNDALYRFIFYDFPKQFLIGGEIYLLTGFVTKHYNKKLRILAPLYKVNQKELGYFILASLLVPTVVGVLKALSQVACPFQLDVFGGNQPYLNIIDSMAIQTGSKCFPASHASVGFALYPLAFLPSLARFRLNIILVVTTFGWLIGGYKMLIGDHFFSHTFVSMLVAWTISSGMAYLFFKNKFIKKTLINLRLM